MWGEKTAGVRQAQLASCRVTDGGWRVAGGSLTITRAVPRGSLNAKEKKLPGCPWGRVNCTCSPSATRMDALAAAGFAAACFPRLADVGKRGKGAAGFGAGLATVGASSFLGNHFGGGPLRSGSIMVITGVSLPASMGQNKGGDHNLRQRGVTVAQSCAIWQQHVFFGTRQ